MGSWPVGIADSPAGRIEWSRRDQVVIRASGV